MLAINLQVLVFQTLVVQYVMQRMLQIVQPKQTNHLPQSVLLLK